LDAHGLTPVLSAPDQIEAWAKLGRELGRALPAAIHFDTGMNRLGLAAAAAVRLLAAPDRLAGIAVVLTMSHLACPEEAAQPMNAAQRDRFDSLRRRLSSAPASLANSAGIFLGRDYHYDLVRPGVALYGVDVRPDRPEKMAQVVQLHGKILQVRDVDIGMTVGYGATHHVTRPGRVATVAVGYADGYLRTLSNRGFGFIGDAKVAVVGRVSMDLITLDVSALPTASTVPGTMVELIGPRLPLGELAALAGTIEYEILTRLGTRFQRDYLGGEG
jgi:alanine racemase